MAVGFHKMRQGKLSRDKAYLSQKIVERLFIYSIQLITNIKNKMKTLRCRAMTSYCVINYDQQCVGQRGADSLRC